MPSATLPARLLLGAALGLALVGMCGTMGAPFQRGWLGHNGARYGQIARNYARLGPGHLGGAPLLDAEGQGRLAPDVYAHHPPALSLCLALASRLAGEGRAHPEDALRWVAALASLAGLLLLARLVESVAGPWAGGLAALVAASMPMVHVYGAHVDVQGAPVLALSLAVLLTYRRWLQGRSAVALVLATIAASAFDWYGLYAPVCCALHLFVSRPQRRRQALCLALLAGLLFAGWVAWLASLSGVGLADVLGSAGVRSAGALAAGGPALATHLRGWLGDTLDLMPGWPALLFLAAWLASGRMRAPDRCPVLGPRGLLLLLLAGPCVHALAFPAGLLMHDYWWFGLPPALAAGFALGAERLRPAAGLAGALLLVLAGWPAGQRVLEKSVDEVPWRLGQALHEQTGPGEVVLTNYDTNPLVPGGYVLLRPEVLYYADRVVRGGVGDRAAWEAARLRHPDARWFLLTPWPHAPDADLAPALEAAAVGPRRSLSGDPPVWLIPLSQVRR